MDLFDLTGHVAVVTGGNSGIGLGMATGLVRAGADVCIWGTNAERNAAARDALAGHGTRVEAIRCDVGEESDVLAAFDETVRRFGRAAGVADADVPRVRRDRHEADAAPAVGTAGRLRPPRRLPRRRLPDRGEIVVDGGYSVF